MQIIVCTDESQYDEIYTFNMKLNSITPLHETKRLLNELLAEKKTDASKKAFMTREMKKHVSFMKDVVEAVTREHSKGWLHGEIFTAYNVKHMAKELVMMQEMRDEIGLKQGQFRSAFGVITIEG